MVTAAEYYNVFFPGLEKLPAFFSSHFFFLEKNFKAVYVLGMEFRHRYNMPNIFIFLAGRIDLGYKFGYRRV